MAWTGHPRNYYASCYDYEPFGDVKIFALNTLLFEDIPREDSKDFGVFLANDISSKKGFATKAEQPGPHGLPWLIEASWTFEDHSFIPDLELLRSVKDEFFVAPADAMRIAQHRWECKRRRSEPEAWWRPSRWQRRRCGSA